MTIETWIKSSGKLIYQPTPKYQLRKQRNVDNHHTIITASTGLSDYYRWWINKQLHLFLQPPMLGEHISLFNGKENVDDRNASLLQQLNGTIIQYEYSVVVEQHWKFWTLPVRSSQMDNIREQFGLTPYHYHITIGRML